MKNIVVISGAGISAESGLKTFRDSNGLWEGHDIMEVATPLGFKKNPCVDFAIEYGASCKSNATRDHKEGVKAFFEKRNPKYVGE